MIAAFSACAGSAVTGSSPIASVAPLQDVYEATDVPTPGGSGNGAVIIALSENGHIGSTLSGEVVWVTPGNMSRAIVSSGAVTRSGSAASISALALNPYTNDLVRVSGELSSSGLAYVLNGSASVSGTATRVASYVNLGQTFVPPAGFIGTLTYTAANAACAGGTVYVGIAGAQPDGNGLWLPLGAVAVSTPPSAPYGVPNGVWDGAHVLFLQGDPGSSLNPGYALGVSLTAFPSAGADGGLSSNAGSTPCTTSLSP